MSKCYLCQTRNGIIPLNVLGQTICRKCNKKVEELIKSRNEERDSFIVSMGNLEVLKSIPEMMQTPMWRRELRKLVLDFITAKEILNGGKRK